MGDRYRSLPQQQRSLGDEAESLTPVGSFDDTDRTAEVHHDLVAHASPMSHHNDAAADDDAAPSGFSFDDGDGNNLHDGATEGSPIIKGRRGLILGLPGRRKGGAGDGEFSRLRTDDVDDDGDENTGEDGSSFDFARPPAQAATEDDGHPVGATTAGGDGNKDEFDNEQDEGRSGARAAAGPSSRGPASPASAKSGGPPRNPFRSPGGSAANSYYSSDDDLNLEDDLVDDDDDDLGRYAFNFDSSPAAGSDYRKSPTPPSRAFRDNGVGEHGNNGVTNGGFGGGDGGGAHHHAHRSSDLDRHSHHSSSSASSIRRAVSAPLRDAVDRVRHVRAERRRKRAERLLALPDDPSAASRTRFALCLSSWCDLTDRGMILLLLAVATATVIYRYLDEEEEADARRIILVVGVPLLMVRVCWRGLYWAALGRRAEERRRATMEVYDSLNREHGTGGIEIPGMHGEEDDSVYSDVGSLISGAEDLDRSLSEPAEVV